VHAALVVTKATGVAAHFSGGFAFALGMATYAVRYPLGLAFEQAGGLFLQPLFGRRRALAVDQMGRLAQVSLA
jgi:hypothetical protein